MDRRGAAVRGDHGQLHRPPGPRDPGADAHARARLARDGLRGDRLLVQRGLWRGAARHGPRHGSHRRARRPLTRRRGVESGLDGACAGAERRRLRRGARPARDRRVRQLPGRREDRRGVVPAARAGPRDRDLQRGHQRGRGGRRAAGPVDRARAGVALGVPRHGGARPRLARGVAGLLSGPGPPPQSLGRRAGVDPQRPHRARWQRGLAQPAAAPPGVGVHRGQDDDGSGVAVLSVLASQVSRSEFRRAPRGPRGPAGRHLRGRGRGLGHRRLDLGGADQARLECEPWPQDGAARRGAGHRPDDVRAGGRHDVGGGEHRRGGGRSAPMVVGQPVHDGERHVPPARRRVGGRPGRVRGDVQRLRVPATHRRRARGGGWQLRADLRGAGARVRRGPDGHASPRAAPRAHCRRAVIRSVYHPSPMKITDIRATPVSVPLEAPLRHANGCHWGRFVRTIVEVETDSGLVGLGELGGGGESASAAVHGLKPYLLGRDPARIEELRFLIANPTASLYNLRTQMLAAVEFACLYLLGQHWRVPVSEILGGRLRDHVPFASYLFFRYANAGNGAGEVRTVDQLVAEARALKGQWGFTTHKLKGGVFPPRYELECYRALARALPGDRLRFDPNGVWSTEQAVWFAREIEDLHNDYLEDPVYGLHGMRRARERIRMPLATNTVVVGFEQLAANVLQTAVDVILLDTTFWGGIRPCVKAAGICEAFQFGVAVHSSGELGIQLATMLHLGAVLPNLTFAADAHYHHLVDDVIEGGKRAYCHGGMAVPTAPGLGVTLDRERVARYHEAFLRLGTYAYDQDPLRPGWTPLIPNSRWADPADARVPPVPAAPTSRTGVCPGRGRPAPAARRPRCRRRLRPVAALPPGRGPRPPRRVPRRHHAAGRGVRRGDDANRSG